MTVRHTYTILVIAACASFMAPANAQETQTDDPPTTLPFKPTVRSAPPVNPTYPQQQAAPPPGDPLCREIGPIIRAGVIASRFASLTPSTVEGAVIGTFAPGGGAACCCG